MSAAVAHSEIDVLIQDTLILIHDQVIWISLWGTALAISNVTFLKASFSNKKIYYRFISSLQLSKKYGKMH